MGMTPAQFAAKIKAQYPQYKDIPDLDLTNKIIAKYPTYKSQVNMGPEPGLVHGGIKGALGSLAGMISPLAEPTYMAGVSMAGPSVEQASEAQQAFHEGRNIQGVGHVMAAALPGIGPGAAQIGSTLGEEYGPTTREQKGEALGGIAGMLLPFAHELLGERSTGMRVAGPQDQSPLPSEIKFPKTNPPPQKLLPRGPLITPPPEQTAAGSQPTGPNIPAYQTTPQPPGEYRGLPEPSPHAEYGPIPIRPQAPPEVSPKQFTGTPIPGAKPPKTMAPQVIPTGTSRGGVGGPPRTETPQPSGKLQQNVRPQTPEIQAQIEQHDQLLKRMLAVKPLRNSPGFPEWNQLFQQVRAARDQLISGTGKPTPTPPPPSVDPGLEKANERVAQPAGTTGAQEAQLRQAKTGVVTPKPVVPDQGPPPVSPRVTGPPRPSAPSVAAEAPKEPGSTLAAPANLVKPKPKIAPADWVIDKITKNFGGPGGVAAHYTGEGLRKVLDIPQEGSVKPFEDAGLIQRTPQGLWEFTDVVQSKVSRVGGKELASPTKQIPEAQTPTTLGAPPPTKPISVGEAPAKPEVAPQAPPKAQAGAKNQTAAAIAELDAQKAPDLAYRDLLSTYSKQTLRKGETWRNRAVALAESKGAESAPRPQLSELEQLKQQMVKEGTLKPSAPIAGEGKVPTPEERAAFREEVNRRLAAKPAAPKPAPKSAAGPGVGLEQGPSKVSKRLGPGPQGTRSGRYNEEGFAQLPLPDLEKVEHYVKGSLVEPTKEGIRKGQAALKFVRNTLAPGSAAKPSILDDFFEMKGLREQKLSEAGKKFPMHESYKGTTLERVNKAINHSEKVMSNLDDYWARQPEGDRWDFIHRIETGQKQANLVNQKIADFYKGMYDEVYKARKQLDPTAAYRKNYWRTPWDREGTGQNAGLYQGKPLKGPQSYLHPKTFPTTAAGRAAGLKAMTSNPNEMFKVNLSEQYRGLTAERFLQAGVKNGYVKEIPVGKSLPAGFERLKDPYPKPYAVTSDAARIINNYLSRSLYSNTTFRTAMGLKTAMTGVELFGPFHALTTTGHAISSDFMMGTRRFWNEGLRQMSPGEAIKGLKDMSKSLGTPVRAAMEGSKLKKWFNNPEEFIHDQGIRGLVNTYPEIKNMIGDLFLAGGKLGVDEEFKLNQLKQMRDAWTRGNIPMAAARVPLVAIQAVMKPLFEHYIPNIKIGLWLKEYASAIRENDAKLASGEVSRATLARDSWANTENMFGELNHDNLMWNRAMKGALQLLYRSVSWRFGNIRLVGSAFRDSFMSLRQSVKVAGDLLQGKASPTTKISHVIPEMPSSLAHAFGSVLATAVVAEIIQHALTGKHLGSAMDVVRPQTGGLDDRGKPVRHTLPFYGSRDFPEMFQMFGAGSKSQSVLSGLGYFTGGTSAFVQRIFDTINNKDFTGGQVYDPHANPLKQGAQIVGHMIPPPIMVQNLSTARKNESTLEKFLEGTVFGKASRRFENTDAENYFLGRKVASIPAEGRDKASVVRADTERELLTYLRNNDKQGFITEARAAAKARILTPNQIRGVVRQSRQSYLANLAERATAPDLIEGFQKSTPEEQKQLLPVLARTLRRSTTTPEQRTQLLQLLRQRNFHTETEQSFGEPVEPEASELPPLTPEPR